MPMDSKGLTFQVRNRRKEVLGTYSAKDIIKKSGHKADAEGIKDLIAKA